MQEAGEGETVGEEILHPVSSVETREKDRCVDGSISGGDQKKRKRETFQTFFFRLSSSSAA